MADDYDPTFQPGEAAFIQVNELDPVRDEGISYAARLLEAGGRWKSPSSCSDALNYSWKLSADLL